MSATPLSNSDNNNKQPFLLSHFKYVCLSEWWLAQPHPNLQCKGLAVGGVAYGERERVFLSTVIAKRYEANVVETEDGITIQLRGFINGSRTSQNGFPSNVCEDFLLGFPDDWQKYTAHSCGDECVNGVTGFAPKSVCNGLANSYGNISKQSVSTENMECSNTMKTVECECKDNTTSPQPLVDMMHNGENGVLDVSVVSQTGNPKNGQSLMDVYVSNPCTGLSGKSMDGSPISMKKIRKDQLLSDCKEKQHITCKDAGKTCSRMVTRSISRRSRTLVREEMEATLSSVGPVRRSPRLYNCRK